MIYSSILCVNAARDSQVCSFPIWHFEIWIFIDELFHLFRTKLSKWKRKKEERKKTFDKFNKRKNLIFQPFLVDSSCVWWCWVLLVSPRSATEMLFCPRQCSLQNSLAIIFGIYFDATVDEYVWWATIDRYGGSNHHHGRLLSSGGQTKIPIFR